MDEETRQQVAARVADLGMFGQERVAREAIEAALEVVPAADAYRVFEDEPSIVAEIVTETRLFTATITGDMSDYIVIEITTRRLDEKTVGVAMVQRRGRQAWTFQFSENDTLTVDRGKDEPFARALASRLGWAPPDVDRIPAGAEA
jgi:hypothetical protein